MRSFGFLVFAVLCVASVFAARKTSTKTTVTQAPLPEADTPITFAFEADDPSIGGSRAEAPAAVARLPVIKGGCSLQAMDQTYRKRRCVPQECYRSGGRCVKEDRGQRRQHPCFQHVERNGVEQPQRWLNRAGWLRQLRYDCSGCVCRLARGHTSLASSGELSEYGINPTKGSV